MLCRLLQLSDSRQVQMLLTGYVLYRALVIHVSYDIVSITLVTIHYCHVADNQV